MSDDPAMDAMLAAARAALGDAWAGRSDAERQQFLGKPVTPDLPQEPGDLPSDPPDVTLIWQRGREAAALSGAVAPSALVADVAEPDRAALLDRLAPEFDRALQPDGWKWTYRAGPRASVLAALKSAARLTEALAEVGRVATDASGMALRRLLSAGTPGRDDWPAERDALAALTQALAWIEPVDAGFRTAASEARRRLGIATRIADCDALLQLRGGSAGPARSTFVGRGSDLQRLQSFVEQPPSQRELRLPLLSVIGVGGAGKSTLLARFVRPYLEFLRDGDPAAPAIVLIDFDRVLFRAGAELELSFEVTRQLAAATADPAIGQRFAERRAHYRSIGARRATSETTVREGHSFLVQARAIAKDAGFHHRTVLLVLDTFEAWQRDRPDYTPRGSPYFVDPADQILEWLSLLREALGLANLRVVASGRAAIAPTGAIAAEPPLQLSDLEPDEAAALLHLHGVAAQDAPVLAALAGRNPLTLRIAARYLGALAPGARAAFLAGGSEGGLDGLSAELRRGVLYGRFLEHVDERVRPLAHPGLALRRVTPALIREVLAGPCGLGELDMDQARALFERLADEVWLVRLDGPDELRHHEDARRAMLPLLSGDPARVAAVKAVHRAAFAWYEAGRDERLTGEAAAVEAAYHQLMQVPDGALVTAPPELAKALGGALDDLPPGARAQLKWAIGQPIADADAAGLPNELWAGWLRSVGAHLTHTGEPARALALLAQGRARGLTVDGRQLDWLAQAHVDTARWAEFWIDRSWGPGDSEYAASLSGVYPLLNALFSDRNEAVLEYCSLAMVSLVSTQSNYSVMTESQFCVRLLLAASQTRSAVVNWPAGPLDPAFLDQQLLMYYRGNYSRLIGKADLPSIGHLRALAAHADSANVGAAPLPGDVLQQLFRPDPAWARVVARLATDAPYGLSRERGAAVDFVESLHNESRRPWGSTAQLDSTNILTEQAARFSKLLPGGGTSGISLASLAKYPLGIATVLRGDNAELRPVVRVALHDLVNDDVDNLALFGAIAQRRLPIPTHDLTPERLVAQGRLRPRETLLKLVEYVDRSGVLRGFLDELQATRPHAALLARVAWAVALWDDAHTQLLTNATARLQAAAGDIDWVTQEPGDHG